MNFEELVSYRECGYENVDKLLWVTSDKGAFGNEKDGPLFDWITDSHDFMSQVKNFNTVIQAGGNCGMYPRFYKNYFKTVYTFEPDDLNFYCLNINCTGSEYIKCHGGLGNNTSKLSLSNGNKRNVGCHKIKDIPGNIQMYRIDDLNLTNCDLIHLDIEGYEPKALEGAIETIKKFNPVIILEKGNGYNIIQSLGYIQYKKCRMDTIFTKL